MENKKNPADLNSDTPIQPETMREKDRKTAAELDRRNAHLKMKPAGTLLTRDKKN